MRTSEKIEQTGHRILSSVKTELYLAMPFLGAALDMLPQEMDLSTTKIGTDAVSIRFNPGYLLQLYIEEPQRLNRTYMHILIHCLLRHMFSDRDDELWDISADIATEALIDSMEVPAVARITSEYRLYWLEKLGARMPVLTAERIYEYLCTHRPDPDEEEHLAREFGADDHGFWLRMEDEPERIPPEQEPPVDPPPESQDDVQPDGVRNIREIRENPSELRRKWDDTASRVMADLHASGKERSGETGRLDRMLRLSLERKKDYREFLHRFSVLREEAKVDPDSFDYGLYQYGLSLYGNLPLIEENEFRQVKKIEELVIAIDTSASCQGELVRQFLDETAQILLQKESFFHRTELYIMECDDVLQREIRLMNVEDLRTYAEQFVVSGGYGTDFRPVFRRVSQLRRKGALPGLRGLLYFTDGRGIYPEEATPYTTAFLFCEEEDYDDANVPQWAEKVIMHRKE